MSRDLTLKAIKKNGKFVRCSICRQHNAVAPFAGQNMCRKCFRPFALGFLTARLR